MRHMRASSFLASGCMNNSVSELCVLKCFDVPCKSRRAPRIIEVNWIPPLFDCIKINTNGAFNHASGKAGFRGVFRNFKGEFIGVFACNLDIPCSDAEVMAVIKAIDLAWVREWRHIWLEVDSAIVLNFIHSPHLIPWRFRVAWDNCMYRVSQMQFQCSHIFREGNQVADALANFDLSSSSLVYWDSIPQFLMNLCLQDQLGLPHFRFLH
ncbi:PREDICTED: uncharacterized protein LOC101309260 [Fragaria vesca subsp. vesca]